MLFWIFAGLIALTAAQSGTPGDGAWLNEDFKLMNIAPPYFPTGKPKELPIAVKPFPEHIRGSVTDISSEGAVGLRLDDNGKLAIIAEKKAAWKDGPLVNASAGQGGITWYATDSGLYRQDGPKTRPLLHASYGVDGPLATRVTALGPSTP